MKSLRPVFIWVSRIATRGAARGGFTMAEAMVAITLLTGTAMVAGQLYLKSSVGQRHAHSMRKAAMLVSSNSSNAARCAAA